MKRFLPITALVMLAHAHATELTGNFIPQTEFGDLSCNPNAELSDFITNSVNSKRATPRNCAAVNDSNPVFYWTRPDGYTTNGRAILTISRITASGSVLVKQVETGTPRMQLADSLPEGLYEWQVSYPGGNGNPFGATSAKRQFRIMQGAKPTPLASSVVTAASARQHPRIVPQGHTHQGIKANIPGDMATSFAALQREADGYVVQELPLEPEDKGTTDQAYNSYLRNMTVAERYAIEVLGNMYFFTNDQRYLIACARRLQNIASWNAGETAHAATSEEQNDQANRELLLGLAIGLDFFQSPAAAGVLNEDEIAAILAKLKFRVNAVTSKYSSFDTNAYNTHGTVGAAYVTEALMYVVGRPDYPDASEKLAASYHELITSAGTWGGTTDGGFGNSTAYGWYAMMPYTRAVTALKLVTNTGLTNFRPISRMGMNLIAQTPPGGQPLMGIFGNDVERTDKFNLYAWNHMRLLAHVTTKPEYAWYWRSRTASIEETRALMPFHFLMLASGAPAVPPETLQLRSDFLFEDAGYVAFHSSTKDPKRSSLFFRSSPLGSMNHSHADNNSFVFVSQGQPVFISSGFYPSYYDKHVLQWTRQTKAKNALTFSHIDEMTSKQRTGVGQAEDLRAPIKSSDGTVIGYEVMESVKAAGKLVNYDVRSTSPWMIATGDATKAYRQFKNFAWESLLNKAYRTAVYHKGAKVALIYDYAQSPVPRLWELNFHTVASTSIATETKVDSGRTIPKGAIVVNAGTAPTCTVLFPQPTIAAPTSTIPAPMPTNADPFYVTQYHIKSTTAAASTEYAVVTMISENCTATPKATLLPGGTAIKVEVGSDVITFDKANVTF